MCQINLHICMRCQEQGFTVSIQEKNIGEIREPRDYSWANDEIRVKQCPKCGYIEIK